MFLGAFFGLSSAFILKKINLNYDPPKEFTILFFFTYFSYITGDKLHLSGLVTMFTCGLFMAHYTYWNVS